MRGAWSSRVSKLEFRGIEGHGCDKVTLFRSFHIIPAVQYKAPCRGEVQGLRLRFSGLLGKSL